MSFGEKMKNKKWKFCRIMGGQRGNIKKLDCNAQLTCLCCKSFLTPSFFLFGINIIICNFKHPNLKENFYAANPESTKKDYKGFWFLGSLCFVCIWSHDQQLWLSLLTNFWHVTQGKSVNCHWLMSFPKMLVTCNNHFKLRYLLSSTFENLRSLHIFTSMI